VARSVRLKPEAASRRPAAGALCWAAVSLLLLGAALAGGSLPASHIDWQPALAGREPWRAFSAAGVHYSRLHLNANLIGLALVAALGLAARLPTRAALAWALAWPLTHFGLLLQPALAHYGGLSGVLHAGVAVAAVQMLCGRVPPLRWLGAAILIGVAWKLVGEAPWAATVTRPSGWDIAVAPGGHLSGALAGVACALLVNLRRSQRRTAG